MSGNSMIAAALPGVRRVRPCVVAAAPRSHDQPVCERTTNTPTGRTLGHRLFLLLIMLWAMMIAVSAGGSADADEPADNQQISTDTDNSAVQLPPTLRIHHSRRQNAPELQVAAWVDQTGPVTPPSLRGKVQLVLFWGMNCPACVQKIPKVREVAERYHGTDLLVIGLHNAQISPAQAAKFARERHLNYPIAIDRNALNRSSWGMTADAYHVRAIPHAAVIDRDGSLRFVGQFEKALQTAESLLKVTSS